MKNKLTNAAIKSIVNSAELTGKKGRTIKVVIRINAISVNIALIIKFPFRHLFRKVTCHLMIITYLF